MNISKAIALSLVLGVSSIAQAAPVINDSLSNTRTSIEYESTINSVLHTLEGAKWQNEKGIGYTFRHNSNITSSWKGDEMIENGIFVDVTVYYYGKEYTQYVGYARKSKINGYVEIFNWDSRDTQNHIKVIDSNTLSIYYHVGPTEKENTFKRVNSFNSDAPKPIQKQLTTEERGTLF